MIIEKTIKNLLSFIYNLVPVKFLDKLISGLSQEFYRLLDYRDILLKSIVPNINMSIGSIPDFNKKYGIPNTLIGTDEEKINRIIEKVDITGFPGPAWFQDQIQKAGFPLYVHENTPTVAQELQFNDFQFSTFEQWGATSIFTNPLETPGVLIVGQPWGNSGPYPVIQYGSAGLQFGQKNLQVGGKDLAKKSPIPKNYEIQPDSATWGFYFWLSPFSDRLAVDDNELLLLTEDQFEYLKTIVISNKLVRNWCIAQVKTI